MYLLSSIVRD